MLKILGGEFKGKWLESRADKGVRPTKSMIREAIFNILRHGKFIYSDEFISDDNPSLIEDRVVVDIFCGSGALGLEAMSRGAHHLYLIDQDQETLKIARSNVAHLGLMERTNLIRSDSSQLPKAPELCDLVFVDPPYNQKLATRALDSLRDQGWLKKGAVIIVEQGKKDDVVAPKGFRLLDERLHDVTRIMVMQYVEL